MEEMKKDCWRWISKEDLGMTCSATPKCTQVFFELPWKEKSRQCWEDQTVEHEVFFATTPWRGIPKLRDQLENGKEESLEKMI